MSLIIAADELNYRRDLLIGGTRCSRRGAGARTAVKEALGPWAWGRRIRDRLESGDEAGEALANIA